MIIQEIGFPIIGTLREPLLVIEWVVFLVALEWAFIFYIRVKTMKNKLKSLQEIAYISLFLGYAFMWVFLILGDYYTADSNLRLIYMNIGYLIMFLGVFFFVYTMEKYKVFYLKFLFSIIFIFVILLFALFIFFLPPLTNYIYMVGWLFFAWFLIISLKDLSVKAAHGKNKKRPTIIFLKFLVSFFVLISGFGMTLEYVVNTVGYEFRLLGDIIQILGIFLLSFFFISLPSLSEFDWQDKIDSIYLIDKSGIFIYKKLFKKKESEVDDNLISAAITTVKFTLEELSENKDFLCIEKEGKIFTFYPKKNILGVLLSDIKLNSLVFLFKNFVNRIENLYSKVLENPAGNLDVYHPIEMIAQEFFY